VDSSSSARGKLLRSSWHLSRLVTDHQSMNKNNKKKTGQFIGCRNELFSADNKC